MKTQTAVILLLCVILSNCTKKETMNESHAMEIPEVESSFDEVFFEKVNHFFSLSRSGGYFTLDNQRIYNFFNVYEVKNSNKIHGCWIYEKNNLNKNFFLKYTFKFNRGYLIEQKGNRASISDILNYDSLGRLISITSGNEDSTRFEYESDYENNIYVRTSYSNNVQTNKEIITKTDTGYMLEDIVGEFKTDYKYHYLGEHLSKVEIISDISKYMYEYRYLENRIVARKTFEKYPDTKYEYEEIHFQSNDTIEIIQHADSNNPERRIVLSEFDQYDNWCLAEEYQDGKFYAKYKRIFEYIE